MVPMTTFLHCRFVSSSLMKKKVYCCALERFAIVDEQGGNDLRNRVEKTLEKALDLVKKCRQSGMLKHVIPITSVSNFWKVNLYFDNSIANVQYLLDISISGKDRPIHMGLPPLPLINQFCPQCGMLGMHQIGSSVCAMAFLCHVLQVLEVFFNLVLKFLPKQFLVFLKIQFSISLGLHHLKHHNVMFCPFSRVLMRRTP